MFKRKKCSTQKQFNSRKDQETTKRRKKCHRVRNKNKKDPKRIYLKQTESQSKILRKSTD